MKVARTICIGCLSVLLAVGGCDPTGKKAARPDQAGVYQAKAKQYDQATHSLSGTLARKSDSANKLYRERGLLHDGKSEPEPPAKESLWVNIGRKRTKKDAADHSRRGMMLVQGGDYDNAIKSFGKAIELRPDDPLPYYRRGLTYWRNGEDDKAWLDLKRVRELGLNVDAKILDMLRAASTQPADDKDKK